jgi:NAD(P)-dependent dehydrogenase (short-subunit alcohol dehydrogenase family)
MKTRTMIVTGAAKGNGAGVTKAFIDRGYNVAADSLDFTNSALAPFLKGLSPTGGISDFRRHCRRNRLPDRRAACNWGGAARGRRCA